MLLSRFGGAPAMVATSNAVRNPGRATATSMALMIAVTLITMMAVGAESSKATLARELDVRNPIDLRVAAVDFSSSPMLDEPDLPQSVVQAVQSDPDVIATTTAQKGFVLIDDVGYSVLAIDPVEAAEVSRIPAQIEGLADGIALVPEWIADGAGLAAGETVDLTMEETGGTATFTVVIAESREWDNDILITRADANRAFPDMPTLEIWARFRSGTDQLDAVNRVQDNIGGGDRFYVSGGALDKAANERVLDTILAVVTGLLGIAVVIALVGVGNTLSLSVIERTRESAMLRAIGLTIPQFRGMLAMEGIMLSVVGALLGILLGIAYGFAGAFTVFAGTWGLVFRLPMERIALIVVIAIVAGLVASLLPARSATRTSLVASLAE
jgi:putative ABC transport system permease protein